MRACSALSICLDRPILCVGSPAEPLTPLQGGLVQRSHLIVPQQGCRSLEADRCPESEQLFRSSYNLDAHLCSNLTRLSKLSHCKHCRYIVGWARTLLGSCPATLADEEYMKPIGRSTKTVNCLETPRSQALRNHANSVLSLGSKATLPS